MNTLKMPLVAVALLLTLGSCDRQSPKGRAGEDERGDAAHSSATQGPLAATQEAPWYEELTLAAAYQKANAERKTVVVEFYSPTCAGSAELENGVLQHKDVRALLAEHTVPIRLNVNENKLLSLRHRIIGTPTLLFFHPDGSEIDRLVGVVERDEFLALAAHFIAGRNRADLALMDVIDAHHQLATTLVERGELREALAEYTWILDRCESSSTLFEETVHYVIRELATLADQHAGALELLERRAASAREHLTTGTGQTIDLILVSTLNRHRGQLADTVALYDEIRSQYTDRELLARWTTEILDALLAARRYEDVAASLNIEQAVNQLFDQAEENRPDPEDYETKGQYLQALTTHSQYLRHAASTYYQVLIGLERDQAADSLAQHLLETAGGCDTLNSLAWAGYLSGRPTETNLQQARDADQCAGRNSAAIADTLARVLTARGQRAEAIQLLQDRIDRANNDRDRNLLEQSLREIQVQS